ncbi:MAG TPA: 4Fe-4S dicluster domain-containing protein [Methanomicrobia archaeon]|nr:4Fe-4S dicluster domain-containing protein [Methanomicrobia archaeon]HEX59660.1 4Fe-4S dicluster domain-containing protein [Methanomicrobia archaeon]
MVEIGDGCTGCGYCEMVCPNGAVKVWGRAEVDVENCIGCLRCMQVCPTRSIFDKNTIL